MTGVLFAVNACLWRALLFIQGRNVFKRIGEGMKMLRTIIATVALTAAAVSPAQARDSFGLSINIGGYGHGHHHAPAHSYHRYHATPRVYYSAPRVIYYEPSIRYRQGAYFGDRHYRVHNYGYKHHGYKNYGHHKKHYRAHGKKHHRKQHHRRHRNHYGWR